MFYGNYGTKFPKRTGDSFLILLRLNAEWRVGPLTGRKSGGNSHPPLISPRHNPIEPWHTYVVCAGIWFNLRTHTIGLADDCLIRQNPIAAAYCGVPGKSDRRTAIAVAT